MPDLDSTQWREFIRQLGENVRALRLERGLTQRQVGDAAGLSEFTYRKIEKGESNGKIRGNPLLASVMAIAEVLEVPASTLIPDDPGGLAEGALTPPGSRSSRVRRSRQR